MFANTGGPGGNSRAFTRLTFEETGGNGSFLISKGFLRLLRSPGLAIKFKEISMGFFEFRRMYSLFIYE